MNWTTETEEIRKRRALALDHGGSAAVARQHEKGRLTIRERIDLLLDADSFEEIGPAAGSGVYDGNGTLVGFDPANFILGFGQINGQRVVVGGEDFTVRGGSPSPAGLRKSIYTEEVALQYRLPLVRLHEGAGGSIGGTSGKGESLPGPVFATPRFKSVAECMATVPVATAALGAVAGLPAARLVASHFSVMSKATAQIMTAGPAVVERAMGERATKDELGGWNVHTKNGTVDNAGEDEADSLAQIRQFLSFLPPNVDTLAPVTSTDDPADRSEEALLDIVPRERRRAFDMRRILKYVVDAESFFEMGASYGRSQIVGLARLNGQPIGVWANNCKFLAGSMTADGAQKARRFMELCEVFSLPIVSFVDEPGFMIGSQAEREATIRHGANAVLTASLTTVPWASVIVRRSFGVAQAAHYGPGAFVLAWPSAESGPLPVEGGVAVAFHRDIAAAENPDARRKELEDAFAAKQSPFPRAEALSVHDLIDPRDTRSQLCRWIDRIQPLLPSLLGPSCFAIRP
ncbi:MAG: carboxyl transferase domain-containing protein [Pseudomonadota bacterium]